MRRTVKIIFLITGMVMLLAGCGKQDAEEVLLKEAQAQDAGDETEKEKEDTSEVTPTETPVIQVICNCQCQCQSGQSSKEGTADISPEDSQSAQAQSAANMQDSGETAQTTAQAEAETADDGKVNINTADSTRLQTLNGIGEARANAIITYREDYGRFQSIEDIMNVEGIKDGVFNKIKDNISVE